ncbi:MAG: SMI1/KNR4 family protein [Sarcina sp.]
MKIVKSLWEEILDIMEDEIPSFSNEVLEEGVKLEKIEEAERVMNIKFPEELKTIYMSNNGTLGLGAILGFELIRLEDMVTEWNLKHQNKIL